MSLFIITRLLIIYFVEDSRTSIQGVSILQILRIPTIIVVCLAVVVAALVWSILDPTLAPHLEQVSILFTYLSIRHINGSKNNVVINTRSHYQRLTVSCELFYSSQTSLIFELTFSVNLQLPVLCTTTPTISTGRSHAWKILKTWKSQGINTCQGKVRENIT